MNPSNTEQIQQVRAWLSQSKKTVVLTGAGISAESGVPTFRGPEGLWRNFSPEELACPEAFARDPKLVWEWYDWRRGLVVECDPNPAHHALVQLEQALPDFTLITQNVDGLHDQAGSSAPLKLHGDIWQIRCTRCSYHDSNRDVPLSAIPPYCGCGALLRPDIVWFGEGLDPAVWNDAWYSAEQADLFLVVGTSALVQPAASLPQVAKQHGARLVEINIEPTGLSPLADESLLGSAADLLPGLVL